MYRESGGAGGRGELLMMRSAPMAMMASAEMEMDEAPMMKMARTSYSGDVNGGGGGGAAAIKVRSDFITTPLFRSVDVGPSGDATVEWTLPDNTGAFELRAYAASDARVGGGTTATQLVRKTLTFQASVPRIARVGDAFSCGATVTASPDLAAGSRVVVSVELAGGGTAVQLKGSSSQQLRLDPSQTTEIVFEMEAVALGGQKLVARVSEEGAASGASSGDAIEMEFEVKGAQPEVMVATSRAIRATGGVALWSEGISLPAAVPGSGGLNLTVGVGRLPAVLSAATILLDAPTRGGRQPISDAAAPELVASLAPLAMLLPYAAQLTTTRRWIDRATAQLSVAAAALAPMTDASTGLHYSRKAKEIAEGADMRLDAHALYILRRLRLAGAALPSALTSLETSWRSALAMALPEQVAQTIDRGGTWSDLELLAAARLALGASWVPTHEGRADVREAARARSPRRRRRLPVDRRAGLARADAAAAAVARRRRRADARSRHGARRRARRDRALVCVADARDGAHGVPRRARRELVLGGRCDECEGALSAGDRRARRRAARVAGERR